ncbi:hypothetical protein PPEP_a0886 [Pseudoalteromonas peptidolytica F12-50-A1]|uniref:Uncharacterized protein n=1 Tax=Pseudoalteromonas peptidolytica F12-50-A1 TaxID=1315280 RepID=A0A8I0MU33_9GAMM|nr:hypothetical protein [Pseudoalteromonas peptidolytica F12-50-A1]
MEDVSFAKPAGARSLLDSSAAAFEVFRSKRLLFAIGQLHRENCVVSFIQFLALYLIESVWVVLR